MQAKTRNAPVAVTIGLLLFGALFIVVAIVYFTSTANSLPSFFPGHQAGSTKHHNKHGIVMIALAALCWIGAWFTTGRRSSAAEPAA